MNRKYAIILIAMYATSILFGKTVLPNNYIDGFTDYNFSSGVECSGESINCQTTAVLPFAGSFGSKASDYARLYLGMYTDLKIVERDDIIKLLNEQEFYPGRLNESTRAKIKEVFGADLLVVGEVWDKPHLSIFNIIFPWRWQDIITKHWYVLIRIIDAETGQIYSNYYLRDGHGMVSWGFRDTYLSESIESLVRKLTEDGQLISSEIEVNKQILNR